MKIKKYLSNRTVYLSGPIKCDDSNGRGWRKEITPKLLSLGLHVIDPTDDSFHKEMGDLASVDKHKGYFADLMKKRRFAKVKDEFWAILRHELKGVDRSDFLICCIDPTKPTVGTIHELVVASKDEQKPILLYVPEEKLELLNPWLLTFIKPSWLFTEWEALFSYLENKIDNGKFDSSHWVF